MTISPLRWEVGLTIRCLLLFLTLPRKFGNGTTDFPEKLTAIKNSNNNGYSDMQRHPRENLLSK